MSVRETMLHRQLVALTRENVSLRRQLQSGGSVAEGDEVERI